MDAREKYIRRAIDLAYLVEDEGARNLIDHLRTTPEGFALVPVGVAALHTNMKTTTSTQPDWHDAPTCAGWWACFEENGGRNVYNVKFPDASWCDGSRYYGPIPKYIPKASDAT